jgi:hypothetical protein
VEHLPRGYCQAGPASLLGVLTTIQAELAPFGSLHDLLHKVNALRLAPRILMPEEIYLSRLAEHLMERGAGKQAWEACPLPLISGLAQRRVMLSLMDATGPAARRNLLTFNLEERGRMAGFARCAVQQGIEWRGLPAVWCRRG